MLGIGFLIYTIIPSVPKMSIIFNYVSWFCIIYLIGMLDPAVFAFIWFKNLKIGYGSGINTVTASTFGVLMIHANSDMMRQWLWRDLLHNADMYNSNYFVLHMFGCTIGIFVVCTLIDMVRIRLVERPFMKLVERMSHGKR